jgi:hypothetical protein
MAPVANSPFSCIDLMSSGVDPDLFQPTLEEHDDLTQIDKPWNPQTITVLGFFFGMVAAGILFGWNFKRLGEPRKQLPTVVGFLLLNTVMIFVVIFGIGAGWWGQDAKQVIKYVGRGLTIVVSLLVARRQTPRYRMAQYLDAPLGSLWVPGILALVVGTAAQFAIAMAAALVTAMFRN